MTNTVPVANHTPRVWRVDVNRVVPVYGDVITGVHLEDECHGLPCVVHAPTNHHMSRWPLIWRYDRKIFERLCPHGTGHPDPDQLPYWRSIGALHEFVHCCCGCCGEREANRVH